MTNIVAAVREIASRMPHQDQATLQNAASMLEFFFGQLQEHSPKMDGTHSYRLVNHWPATHCNGRTPEEAVIAAVRAVQCGNVTVTMDATLTDAEREAIERGYCSLMGVEDMSAECSRWDAEAAAALRGLLDRTK